MSLSVTGADPEFSKVVQALLLAPGSRPMNKTGPGPARVQAPDAAVTWHGGQPRALGACGGQRRRFHSPEREAEVTASPPAQGSGPSQTGVYPGAHVASEKKPCRAILWWKKGTGFSLKTLQAFI